MNGDRNIERSSKIDTATLSDALDKLDIKSQCLDIKPLKHAFRLTGRAFTLLYGPLVQRGGTVGDYIDDVPAGAVIVIDNQGKDNATVWGDILTMCSIRRGLGGTVIDGACRDTALALELNYPVYSRSYSMRTGKDRVQLDARNVVVRVGGASVSPGDLIRGDADGVLAIPQAREVEILDLAEAIQGAEERVRQSVMAGQRLDDARRQQGYHLLQRREQGR